MYVKLCVILVLHCSLSTNVQGINGGALVKIQDYKYNVGITVKTHRREWFCGGALVGKKFILTAAHCFTIEDRNVDGSINSIKSDLGRVKVYMNTDSMETYSNDTINVKAHRVYFLEEYYKNGIANLAILELKKELDFTNGNLEMLAIPTSTKVDKLKPHESFTDFTAYGFDHQGPESANLSLKYMNVQLTDTDQCQKIFNKMHVDNSTRLCGRAIDFHAIDNHPKNPKGLCGGDVGGPLVKGNTIIGIAIASVNDGECDNRDEYPALFTRVAHYIDFIKEVMSGRVRLSTQKIRNVLLWL